MNKEQTTIEVGRNALAWWNNQTGQHQCDLSNQYGYSAVYAPHDYEIAKMYLAENPDRNIEVDALEWFGNLSSLRKTQLCDTNQKIVGSLVRWEHIGLNQIVCLYKAEHPTAPTVEKNSSSEGYTEGEWLVNELSLNESAFEILTDSPNGQNMNGYIAYIKCDNYTVPGMAKANAELIANAPRLKQENKKLLEDNKLLREALQNMESSFYMDICRAYNAGKQNMSQCVQAYADNNNDNSAFKSSHDYFKSEFPEFTKNVP